MLGQLLHSINPRRTHSRQTTFIESDLEETHTRGLLFPDAAFLQQSETLPQPLPSGSPGSPYSPGGSGYDFLQREIDLDSSRDIRIIIAQDESNSMPRTVLFDSKPPPSTSSPTQTTAKSARPSTTPTSTVTSPQHARRSSIGFENPPPKSPAIGAFARRTRGASISSLADVGVSSFRPKDIDEQTKNCMDCMFGNVAMSYRGASNKLHIVPLEQKAVDRSTDQFINEGRFSLPKGDSRKPSHLSKSYLPTDYSSETLDPPSEQTNGTAKDRRRTIMISRIFSVTLPDDGKVPQTEAAPVQPETVQQNRRPKSLQVNLQTGVPPRRSTRKLPMYGISVIMQLPVGPPRPASQNAHPGPRSLFQPSEALGQDSLASSLDSNPHGSWSWVDSGYGMDSWLSNSYVSDVDDRVDLIGRHWDVVIRTLSSIQQLVQKKITDRFKAQDEAYYRWEPTSHLPRPLQPSRNTRLPPSAFASDPDLSEATGKASERIVRGIKIPRVVTGQGRWDNWRDEARWLGKWAGTKEENFFFFTLLTAFLGHHVEWLNILGPGKDRKLHRQRQAMKAGEDLTMPIRTIIVSKDKMAARRLIFLLSAFLPASSPNIYDTSSPVRPGTSASDRGYSQSPPSYATVSRQQSLRRTINRRGRASQSTMRLVSRPTFPSTEPEDEQAMPSPGLPEGRHHVRRASERSVHTALAIPTMSDGDHASKASTATTSTVTPETAVPLAHFAMKRSPSFGAPEKRPPSSESLASANLMHTLNRTGSSHHVSQPSNDSSASRSRWGSLISNFWSNSSRDSSTDHSDILQSTDEGLVIPSVNYRKATDLSSSKLEQMVRELEMTPPLFPDERAILSPTSPNDTVKKDAADGSEDSTAATSSAVDIPERPRRSEPVFRMSVNENDGIIDVDIPLPGFGSPTQSPFPQVFNSSSSLDASNYGQTSMCSFSSGDFEQPVNVAGWLGNNLHADFALQGVTSYPELDRDVHRAMRLEPTPISEITMPVGSDTGPVDKWVDVCTTLVADTQSFTVKKIRYRRLVRLMPAPMQTVFTPAPMATAPKRYHPAHPFSHDHTQPVIPVSEYQLDDSFSYETLMDIDELLATAVERILATSSQSSRIQSGTPSRSSSRPGRTESSLATDSQMPPPPSSASTVTAVPVVEVGRGKCKRIVLGALDQVVKDVVAERDLPSSKDVGDRKGIGSVRQKSKTDSTLREGVRKWMSEAEEMTVKKDYSQVQR